MGTRASSLALEASVTVVHLIGRPRVARYLGGEMARIDLRRACANVCDLFGVWIAANVAESFSIVQTQSESRG